MTRTKTLDAATSVVIVHRLLRLLWRRPARLRLDILMGVVEDGLGVLLAVAAPFVLKAVVVALADPTSTTFKFLALITLLVLAWTASGVLSTIKLLHTSRMVDTSARLIGEKVLKRQLPIVAMGKAQTSSALGAVLQRLPFSLQLILDGVLWRVGPLFLQLIAGLLALSLSLPPRYAVLLGVVLLAYLTSLFVGERRIAQAAEQAGLSADHLAGELNDVLRNCLRVVCNGAVGFEVIRLRAAYRGCEAANIAAAAAVSGSIAVQHLVLAAGLSLVLFTEGLDVHSGRLPISDFVLLQAFALRLALPLGGVIATLRQAGPAFANVRDALKLAEPAELTEPPPVSRPAITRLGLEIVGVSFAYDGDRGEVKAVDLHLAPDQVVAVVGANGSGKSTLAKLMAGLLEPDKGLVRVAGHALTDIAATDRHRHVLYVPQHVGLFNRSLAENGLYPPSWGNEAALKTRLLQWSFHQDGHPVSLGAAAGEDGDRLSGGQIQKLELARLCSVDTPVLILDESTSALDRASEHHVLRTLREQHRGRLLILITHRRQVAASADLVLLLDAGRLIACGSHERLLRRRDYRRLWDDPGGGSNLD